MVCLDLVVLAIVWLAWLFAICLLRHSVVAVFVLIWLRCDWLAVGFVLWLVWCRWFVICLIVLLSFV